jgi:hypothetical protein
MVPQAEKSTSKAWTADQERKKARGRDTVGEKTGVSGKTAEQSAFCVRDMDALDRSGKTLKPLRYDNCSERMSVKPTGSQKT